MNRLLAAGVAAGLLAGCSNGAEANPTSTFEANARQAIAEFDSVYDCPIDIALEIRTIDIDSPLTRSEDGVFTGGTATRGVVIIDPVLITAEAARPNITRHTAIHESAHACNKGEIIYDQPFDIVDAGITMTGSEGLSAVGISKASGERLTFSLIEEGVADLLAFDRTGLEGASRAHTAMRRTTEQLFAERGISLQAAQDLQENSDLLGLLSLLLKKSASEITAQDISTIFNIYLDALDAANRSN